MTGVSGCFGGTTTNNIDNVEDVSATVDEIIEKAGVNASDNSEDAKVHLYYYISVEKRLRMLTLAVVALAIVVLSKEL